MHENKTFNLIHAITSLSIEVHETNNPLLELAPAKNFLRNKKIQKTKQSKKQ